MSDSQELRHGLASTEGETLAAALRRPAGRHYRKRSTPHPRPHRLSAFALALALIVGYTPTLGGFANAAPRAAAAGGPVVTREDGTNGCNGVLPNNGSENTNKRLDPDFPSDFSPGGTVGYIIDFPVSAADVSGRQTFVITDCLFLNGTAVAKYSVTFVPNTEAFQLKFALVIPDNAPLGSELCNFAKTTAAPSASPASNRKAGPACFTVGGAIRIEKRANSLTGPLLPGASFSVSCRPTGTVPPTVISGLSSPSGPGTGGTIVAAGTSASGTIAIVGPSGTPCTVAETAAPAGFLFDAVPRVLVIPVSTTAVPQLVSVFINRQTSSLTVTKRTTGGSGTFNFTLDCNGESFDRTFSITDSGTESFNGIPVGTSCSVTETPDALFVSSVLPANGTVTIDADGESIAFTNTRRTGALVVAKTTTGGTGTFTFDVDCGGVLSRLEITGTGSRTISGIPTGTSCRVTEVADSLFTSSVSPANGTVTIDEDGERVAFTNTRNTGSLVISKRTEGGSGTFTFTVDCDVDSFDRTVTISNSGSSTISGIPTGTRCAVAETPDPEFTSSVNPADGTVTIAQGNNTVAFANTAKPAALAITKKADRTPVAAGEAIGFTLTVTNSGTGTARKTTLSDPLPGTTGVNWTISPAYSGPGACAVSGAAPSQTLSCSFGDLAPAATASVHVTSPTSASTAATLDNVGTAAADNNPAVQASARVVVTPAPVTPIVKPVVEQPAAKPVVEQPVVKPLVEQPIVAGVVVERPAPAPVVAPSATARPAAAPATLPRTGSNTSAPVRGAIALLVIGGLALIPEHLRNRRNQIIRLES